MSIPSSMAQDVTELRDRLLAAATYFAASRDDRAIMFTQAWLSVVELESKEHPMYQATALAAVRDIRALKQALREAMDILDEARPGNQYNRPAAWTKLL